MAAAIIGFITSTTAVYAAVNYALAVSLTNFAISYAIRRAFSSDQDIPADVGVTARIQSNTANKLPVVYGAKAAAGSITMADITSNNQKMAFIVSVAEGGIEEVTSIQWEDKTLTFNGNLNTGLRSVTDSTDGDGNSDDFLNGGRFKCRFYPNGGRCEEMEGFSSKWKDYTGAFDAANTTQTERQMPNVAYAYMELTYDKEKRVTGLPPSLFFNLKGRKVKTLSSTDGVVSLSSTETYSTNPSDCLLDYLTNDRYGCNIPLMAIDLDSFYSHKTFCDVEKSYVDTNDVTQMAKRYTVNGFLSTMRAMDSNISHLTIGNSVSFNWNLGQFALITNKVTASTHSFSEDSIYGGIDIAGTGFNNKINQLTLKYASKQEKGLEAQIELLVPESNKNKNEPVLERTISFPMTDTNIEAERAGAIFLNTSRQNLVAQFTTDLSALAVQAGDVVSISHSTPGWEDKKFLVTSIEEQIESGAVGLRITAHEYADGVFDDRTINELDPAPNTNFPSPYKSPVVTGLVLLEDTSVPEPNLVITWSDANPVFSSAYIIGYRKDNDPSAAINYHTVTGGTRYALNGLEASTDYFVQVTPTSTLGGDGLAINATGSTGVIRVGAGDVGKDGRFRQYVYQRNTSMPATPTGGSFNLVGNELTAPNGWSEPIPPTPADIGLWESYAIVNPALSEGGMAETGFFDLSGTPGAATSAVREVTDIAYSGTAGTYTIDSPGTAETNTISVVGARAGSDATSAGFKETSDITFTGTSSTSQDATPGRTAFGASTTVTGSEDLVRSAINFGGSYYVVSSNNTDILSITEAGVTAVVSSIPGQRIPSNMVTDGTTIAILQSNIDGNWRVLYTTDPTGTWSVGYEWTQSGIFGYNGGEIMYANGNWVVSFTNNIIRYTTDITSTTAYSSTNIGTYGKHLEHDGTRYIIGGAHRTTNNRVRYSTSLSTSNWTILNIGTDTNNKIFDFAINGDELLTISSQQGYLSYGTGGITGSFTTYKYDETLFSSVAYQDNNWAILGNFELSNYDSIAHTTDPSALANWTESTETFTLLTGTTISKFSNSFLLSGDNSGSSVVSTITVAAQPAIAKTDVTINPFGLGDRTLSLDDASTATQAATQVRSLLNTFSPTEYTVKTGSTALVELEYNTVGDQVASTVSETTPSGSTTDGSVATVNGAPQRIANNSIEETDITFTGVTSTINNVDGSFVLGKASGSNASASLGTNETIVITGSNGSSSNIVIEVKGSINSGFDSGDVIYTTSQNTLTITYYRGGPEDWGSLASAIVQPNIQNSIGGLDNGVKIKPVFVSNNTGKFTFTKDDESFTFSYTQANPPNGFMLSNEVSGSAATTSSSYTLTLDSTHSASPITGSFPGDLVGTEMATFIREDLNNRITAGTLTEALVKAGTNNVVELDSSTGGARLDAVIVINNTGNGNAEAEIDVHSQGGLQTLTSTSYTISSGAAHSPSSVSGTFANHASSTTVATVLRGHFLGGSPDIGGYTVSVIANGVFLITSDELGNETPDLSINITTVGTDNDLTIGNVVVDGTPRVLTGIPTVWTIISPSITYSQDFASGVGATAGQNAIVTYVNTFGFHTASIVGGKLRLIDVNPGPTASRVSGSITTTGTSATMIQPVVTLVTLGALGTSDIDSIKFNFNGLTAIEYDFATGLTTSQTADAIALLSNTEILFEHNNNFSTGVTLPEGNERVKFTYIQNGIVTDNVLSNLVITTGDTLGTLLFTAMLTTTQGGAAAALGDWSLPIETSGLRGAGDYAGAISLAVGVSAPVVGSAEFATDALDTFRETSGRPNDVPVAGDVVTVVYTSTAGVITVVTARNDGTGIAGADWTAYSQVVDGNLLVTGTVNGNKIEAGTINALEIAADAITLNKIPIGELTTTAVGSVLGVNAGSTGNATVRVPGPTGTITLPPNSSISMNGSFVLGGNSTQFTATPILNVSNTTDVTFSGLVAYATVSGGNKTNPFVGRVTTGSTATELSLDMTYSNLDGSNRQISAIFSYIINRR